MSKMYLVSIFELSEGWKVNRIFRLFKSEEEAQSFFNTEHQKFLEQEKYFDVDFDDIDTSRPNVAEYWWYGSDSHWRIEITEIEPE